MLYNYKAHLVRVIDGDTVVLDIDLGFGVWLRKQNIRLLGINAYELKEDRGPEAKAFLFTQLTHPLAAGIRELLIETHKGDEKDKYGRWLGTIWYKDHTGAQVNVNRKMVDAGLAKDYPV